MLYSMCGYFVVYQGMQYAVKKEVKRKIKNSVPVNELHLLKISKQTEAEANPEIFQRIHEGEFRYYGQMYDIVYKMVSVDTTYYHCIHDKEEQKLFAELDKAINMYIAQNPEQQQKQKNFLQKLVKEYIIANRPNFNSPFIEGFTFNVDQSGILPKNYFYKIPSPPPDLLRS